MNEEQNNSLIEIGGSNDFFIFAVTTLQPLLHTLESQIEGATQATDIECIHKLRVTSRRIRAALSVFKSCFPKELQLRWRQEIRAITQSLGAARDLDVQILFLEQHLQSLSNAKDKNGIKYLLKEQRQHRAAIQPDVVAHLTQLKESGVLEELREFCTKASSKDSPGFSHTFTTYTTAQTHIRSRLADFFSLQEYVTQEDEIKKHHQMRIAAKHLRYTMELFSSFYEDQLIWYITAIKQFQDFLGEMHDCDVWAGLIPTLLEEVRQKDKDKTGNNTSKQDSDIQAGLTSFLLFIRNRRHRLYTDFTKFWEENTHNSMFSSLEELTQYTAVIPRSYPKKIVLLADVHGNLDALQAVLEDVRRNDAALILNAGDLVGYCAFPQEVVSELQSENVINILGNFDREILEWKKNSSSKPGDEKEISLEYAAQQLQKTSFNFLKSLPKQVKLKIGEKSVLMVHGSPASINEHIYPDTSDQRLHELFQQANTDVLIVGHTHTPFLKTIDQSMVVNPGSVGRPGDGDDHASYALLTIHPFSIELKKVPYDIMHAVDALRQRNLPERFAQMLLQGSSLDNLVHQELIKTSQKKALFVRSIRTTWRNEKQKRQIQKVSERYISDIPHAYQVTRIALSIFDQLSSLHPLGAEDRFFLECAGLLHDIGLSHGVKGHHKTSFRLILSDPYLPLNARQRQMISIITRYHRKKPPAMHQQPFRDLNILDRTRVEFLAAILRVADGLDASHCSLVKKVDMQIVDTSVMMRCLVNGNTQLEEEMVNKKKDLFEKMFNRSLLITMQDPSAPKEKSLDS